MDLDFSNENNRFNARVAAIIYNNDKTKVLLFKVDDGRDFYMLPGGRIEFNEDSNQAIKREIKEELGWDLDYKLCSIQENFINVNGVNIMQYCFCYKGIYCGDTNNKPFNCLDNKDQLFKWVEIKDIDNYKILPLSIKHLIISKNACIEHIIEK